MSAADVANYAEFLRDQALRCRRLADLQGTSADVASSLRKMAQIYDYQAAGNEDLAANGSAQRVARG